MVISPPCHQPVNRAVYRELAEQHGIPVHLVVPRRLFVGSQWRDTPPSGPAPYELTMLDLTGTHGRLQRLSGLDAVAAQWRPTHVLVDNDPATLMTWQAARTCPQAKLWALTAENLTPRYLRDFAAGLKAMQPARMVGPLMVWALRFLVHPRVDRVFTLSSDGTRVMEALGCTATQIPLGFDPTLFRIQSPEKIAATRERLGLRQPTVAYFGRLTPEKGLHLLLEALASIKDEPWQFLVDHFSDYQTDYTRELQVKIEALGLADRVVYFDAKHDEMPHFMNAADIVVLPSLSTPKWKEQYGRVLPEAMACGKVVIGSDSGAIPELVGAFGHIVPEGDVPALATKLRELLRRSDLKAEGERAAAYAHERLSMMRQAQIWADLLHA
jgi:glycosyltransferase involved in cell wall biosynthesis